MMQPIWKGWSAMKIFHRSIKWERVTSLALAASLCASYLLIPRGVTAEGESYICGMVEHTHTGGCYQLVCGKEERFSHTHVKPDCYDEEGHLTCELKEQTLHHHTQSCYSVPQPECGLEESEEHTHTAECYPTDFQPQLICGQEDVQEHRHTGDCYRLVCQLAEHSHTELCIAVEPTEEPQETEATEPTEETQEPEVTEPTEETQEPEVTEPTEETQEPEVTEPTEETQEPEVTEPTEETQEPEVTEPTEETQETEATEPTEETQEPEVTEPTEETQETVVTEPTEETQEPEATEPTEETQEPEVTEPTEETQEPAATEPTEETQETEATEPTGEPQETEATEPTEEPQETEVTEPTEETQEPEATEPTEETQETEATEPTGEPEGTEPTTLAAMKNIADVLTVGTLTVTYPKEETVYHLFRVGSMVNGTLVLDEEFSGVSTADWKRTASVLSEVIQKTGRGTELSQAVVTGGSAVFGGLGEAVYLVMGDETVTNGITDTPVPFLTAMPGTDGQNQPVWDVQAAGEQQETMDISVTKVWVGDRVSGRPASIIVHLTLDGKDYGPLVRLNYANHWSYTWENLPVGNWSVREESSRRYTTTMTREGNTFIFTSTWKKIPQTGQLWWPVAAMSAAGVCLVGAGLLRRRKQDKNA